MCLLYLVSEYCLIELLEFDSGVQYSREFVAENLNDTTVPNIIDKDIIISEAYWHCIKKNDKYM